ncbi:MAG: amino acid permease [Gemmataceae bacterium]
MPTELAAQPHFQRRLGLFDSTMLVAGAMIGSGIFIVSADIARSVGSSGWLMTVWIISGVMTLLGALSYAELAAMMPKAGGQYVYLREAYSPMWGFLYGWTGFVVIQTGTIAAVGVAFAKFLGVLVPELGPQNILYRVDGLDIDIGMTIPWLGEHGERLSFYKRSEFTISAGQIIGVAVVVFLTYLNTKGVREGKIVQNIFTVAKTLALILLIVAGLTIAFSPQAVDINQANVWDGIRSTADYQKTTAFAPEPIAIVLILSGALVGALFSSDAWNNVTFTAGEVNNPRRTLPWSLALGVGGVVTLYALANVAYLCVLPVQGDPYATQANNVKLAALRADVAEAEAEAASWQARTERARLDLMAARKELKAAPAEKKESLEAEVKLREETIAQATKLDNAARARAKSHQKESDDILRDAPFARGIDAARDDRVGTAVLERVSPRLGVSLMAIAIMVSTFGCLNGLILMGARLFYAMARDRLFFRSVGSLNKQGVPAVGLVLQCVWASLLIFSGSYNELLDYVIFAVLFFYALTTFGLFILRRKRPDAERPYKAIGYPVLPAFYILLCATVCLGLLIIRPVYSWPSFLLLLLGIPVYFLWPGKDASQRPDAFASTEE